MNTNQFETTTLKSMSYYKMVHITLHISWRSYKSFAKLIENLRLPIFEKKKRKRRRRQKKKN